MSLRKKIIIITILITIIVIGGLYSLLNFQILNGFHKIESQIVEKNISRVKNGIDANFDFLIAKSLDWAHWDETYRFVDDKNEKFIRENIVADAFSSLDINIIAIFNKQGKLVIDRGVNLITKEEEQVPQAFIDKLKSDPFLSKKNSDSTPRYGFITIPDRPPLFIVMNPIVKSNGDGPINGTLIFARYIDEEIENNLQKYTLYPLSFKKIDDLNLKENSNGEFEKAAVELINGNKHYGTAQKPNDDYGYILIKDIDGNPGFIFQIVIEREIHKQSHLTLLYVLWSAIFGIIALAFFVFHILQKYIFTRLFSLSDQVQHISHDNYQKLAMPIGGNDEISFLAKQIDNMLARLAAAQTKLQKNEERYKGIIESQEELIVRLDNKGRYTFVNEAYCQKFGKNKIELLGKKFTTSNNQNGLSVTGENLKKLASPPYRIYFEQKVMTQEGLRWISWEEYAIKDNNGQMTEIQAVGRDVTRLKEIDQMKSEFISIASHQLRTPLTTIKWYLELLLQNTAKNNSLSADEKEFLAEINSGNERMINLVNNLLNVSRIEDGEKFSIDKRESEIFTIIDEIIQEQSVLREKREIQLILKTKSQPFKIFIDREKIHEAFQNLIHNAIKYSLPGSKIFIDWKKEKENIIFTIQNKGVGIPKKQQKRIFEKFFRADNVRTLDTDGTGLGLYIVKAIIEGHDGKIWFESEENKTTTFYFSLPLK